MQENQGVGKQLAFTLREETARIGISKIFLKNLRIQPIRNKSLDIFLRNKVRRCHGESEARKLTDALGLVRARSTNLNGCNAIPTHQYTVFRQDFPVPGTQLIS